MKLEKIGMRTIKSGIGVMLCVLVSNLKIIQNPFFAAISCVVAMQTTVKGSLRMGINRVKGTIIGGIVGFLFAIIYPGNAILAGLGVIATIYSCNVFKLNKAISVACVTYCAIYLGVGTEEPFLYSLNRIIDTSMGVIIGVFINYFISRPDYLQDIYNEFKIIEEKVLDLVKKKLIQNQEIDVMSFYKEVVKLEATYKLFIEELDYMKDDIKVDKLENTLIMCKEIYFHLQSIEFLQKKCYLSSKNYEKLKKFYGDFKFDLDISEEKSPVFNYHLSMIIKEIEILHKINETIE